MAIAGVLSCILVSTLLLSITVSALASWFRTSREVSAPFTSRQIAIFVVCLLVSDLIQSVSGITQVKWAAERRLYEGQACSVQAFTLVMGDLGSTVWSCVIAAHTFCGLALGKQWSKRLVYTIVIIGWTFVIAMTLLGPLALTDPAKGPFFSIAGTWCFISSPYALPRLYLHYVPLFIASALIVLLYGLVFFVLRGTISFTPNLPQGSALPLNDMFARQRVMIAKRMLWYPIAYLTAIMPITVIRIIGLKEDKIPDWAWIIGLTFLFSLGAVDAIIYATTRHVVKPLTIHVQAFSMSNSDRSISSRPKLNTQWDLESAPPTPLSAASFNSIAREKTRAKVDFEFHQTQSGVQITTEQIQSVL
ncbi:hypothetical protein M422DRAFT_46226 [Sphaerobolus stellatus SS14]|uniref:Glucose receptor Git3 N-terminal domain-containing protein n=1 Tax=Sphaerobolus stellatus (strain SS14) TaxID=990650 RepID=A0A0C9UTG1_SPHS4|nr:hypothetical protein M422DRAFT_46226 [Sphaerobolus stellatus SS14]